MIGQKAHFSIMWFVEAFQSTPQCLCSNLLGSGLHTSLGALAETTPLPPNTHRACQPHSAWRPQPHTTHHRPKTLKLGQLIQYYQNIYHRCCPSPTPPHVLPHPSPCAAPPLPLCWSNHSASIQPAILGMHSERPPGGGVEYSRLLSGRGAHPIGAYITSHSSLELTRGHTHTHTHTYTRQRGHCVVCPHSTHICIHIRTDGHTTLSV